MKVLSIKQPWAWLIVNGYKDIENRTWKTNYRGPFLIHASKKFDEGAYGLMVISGYLTTRHMPHKKNYSRGAIIGMADLIDCVTKSESRWFGGPFGFVIRNPIKINPIPFKGKLRFFGSEFQSYDDLKIGQIFQVRKCRICGCTDDDCSQCIEAQGYPCHWVEDDLCSRCDDEMTDKQNEIIRDAYKDL